MPRWLLVIMGVSGFGAVALGVLLSAQPARPVLAEKAAEPIRLSATAPMPAAVEAPVEPDREAKRLARYDKDDDGNVSREEYLAARRKAYAKQDVNGDGVLQFEEFAVKSVTRFERADGDRSGVLTASEFATTRTQRKKPADNCPEPKGESEDG
jgi:EF hand